MRRFILERNIERFELALRSERDPVERRIICELLDAARRELAALTPEDQPGARRSRSAEK